LKRVAVIALAAVSVVVAVALTALAVDVLRVPSAIAADDARYAGAPLRQNGLWDKVSFLPGQPAERILDVGDDLAYRKVLWAVRRVPSTAQVQGPNQPQLEARRGQAVIAVSDRAQKETERRRRAQLLNINGVFIFQRINTYTQFDHDRLLREAIGNFRSAVRLDPSNADARANLELAVRAAKGTGLPGEDPDTGASKGQKAGQGRSGSGY
jgi:hypothetical protein